MKITIPYLLKCLKNVVIVLQKYMACNIQFLYSQKWSKGREQTLHWVLDTFVSKTVPANFDIFPDFFFLRLVKL